MFSLSRMVGERLLTRIREVAVQVRRPHAHAACMS
jgi:hypothetical protein